ncbi:MAG: PPC domain-containing DNA-binding protein [Cyanobacteria bacterium P01_A01_bin.114]
MHLRGTLETLSLRLAPGSDIYQELRNLTKQEKLGAGIVLSAVGSLSKTRLRFADQETPTDLGGKHEILSLTGTLGEDGLHLHMAVANAQGECRGGHVVEGCRVYTTLELVIAIIPEARFDRVVDPATGYRELVIVAPNRQLET